MKKISFLIICFFLIGCSHLQHNAGNMDRYRIPEMEAQWIQDGQPIIFEGGKWYPQDRFDVLVDAEVYFKGEYKDIPFFVEKIDIRPYQKLLTKFGRNKFRVFVLQEKE